MPMPPRHRLLGAAAALLALAPPAPALDGRNAVTQYAWASANCTGPIVGVLATYRLNECTESVYPGVFLYITWVRDPLTQMPDAIMYSHYQDPQCQHFLSNSSEGLMDCSARPGGFALRPGGPSDCHSKTMVYGPAQIQMTSKPARSSPLSAEFLAKTRRCCTDYFNSDCSGKAVQTKHYLSYACWNTPQGSESVDKDYHHCELRAFAESAVRSDACGACQTSASTSAPERRARSR